MLDLFFSSIECMIDKVEVREPFSSSDHDVITFDLLYDSQITTWKEYCFDYRRGNDKETDKSEQGVVIYINDDNVQKWKVWIGMHYSVIVMLTKSGLFSEKCWIMQYPSLFHWRKGRTRQKQ